MQNKWINNDEYSAYGIFVLILAEHESTEDDLISILNIYLKYLLNILSSGNIKNIDYIFFYKFNLIFVVFEAEEFPKEHSLSKSILLPFSLLRWVWLFRSSSLSFFLILLYTSSDNRFFIFLYFLYRHSGDDFLRYWQGEG